MITKKEINTYTKKLKDKRIRYRDIPDEIRLNEDFITAIRKAKIRFFERRGYDVINNEFFVYEYLEESNDISLIDTFTFETFDEYYTFLNGDIYDNSCYYQYIFSKKQIKDYNLDISKLKNTHFTCQNIDDWEFDDDFDAKYKQGEKNKKQLFKWIDKFMACKSSDEFLQVMNNFNRSKFDFYRYKALLIDVFIWSNRKLAFDVLIDLCNREELFCISTLAIRYDAHKVLDLYNPTGVSKQTRYKRRKELKDLLEKIELGQYEIRSSKGFDEESHLFYVNTYYQFANHDYHTEKRYFFSFEHFASFLNNDLSDCNLSSARLDIDLSKYVVNDKTILPFESTNIEIRLTKKYDGRFYVSKEWLDSNGNVIKQQEERFKFFFDFLCFLKGDLSGIDFLFCDGIINLNDISALNIKDCRFKSDFLEKFRLKYDAVSLPALKDYSFNFSKKNETSTELVLQHKHELRLSFDEERELNRIAYISDIHLMHRFIDCKSENDREAIVRKLSKMLCFSRSDFLLIGGDVSSESIYYNMLLECIYDYNKDYGEDEYDNTIFILGNHELWNFPDKSFDEIVKLYQKQINDHKCYLLQNSIIYKQIDKTVGQITEEELSVISEGQLREKLAKAQLIIFGGLAFSGLNEKFNADNGIYRNTISRSQEISESKKFEKLYDKVCKALYDKNVIIFTHTPREDWTKQECMPNFVYVSGHTHRNYFYDDGSTRIYADNQIGYKKKEFFLKKFYISKEYEYFADYKDGIYEISKDQYNDFYRAKNIGMDYNRDGTIFMLKRNEYYCFFREGKTRLSMLNGGALVSVPNDLNYYYDNMLKEIAFIKKPLDKYTNIQQKISDQVKSIGGRGTIHGAIIDIDFYNHIYVNPNDLVITGYFAYDIIFKQVYKNIPSLLKAKCPALYENYRKLLSGKTDNALVVAGNTEIDTTPEDYFETDIYKASREIKKMQKVNKGILSTWYDPNTGANLLE